MSCAANIVALAACLSLYTLGVLTDSEVQSGEIILDYEQIFINILDGPTFSLIVESDATGWDLRNDINEIERVPYERMVLKIGDTLLNTTRRLSESYTHAPGQVNLEIPDDQSSKLVEFSVKTLDGRDLKVSTHLNNSVASLKGYITQWTGIPKAEQRLLLDGTELRDDRKLALYLIYNGTTVELGRPLDDCRQVATVFVKTLSGASIEVEVDLADTVTDLKNKIWDKAGVPTGVQRLVVNRLKLAGEDHLCDLGLEAGSTVYMSLYSLRIRSSEQVARLQESPAAGPVNNYKAPIFREVEDEAEPVQSSRRPVSLYKDERNWDIGSGSGWDSYLLDPVAHLVPDPDDEVRLRQFLQKIEYESRSDGVASRLATVIDRARLKLSLAVRPYRQAANLTSANLHTRYPGISLGGGFAVVGSKRPVSLGADINNWAPDGFSDLDLMRLFEVAERVRQVLARTAQTGEGILGIASQKRMNKAMLLTYLQALVGYSSPVAHDSVSKDEDCAICRDDLPTEPAIKLPCEHAFHVECMQTWVANIYGWPDLPACPYCLQRFMFSYELQGKAELETPELQVNQDK